MSEQRWRWPSIIGFAVLMGLVMFGGRLVVDRLFGDPLDLPRATVIGVMIAVLTFVYGAAVRRGWTPPNRRKQDG